MKKLLFLLPFLFIACTSDEPKEEQEETPNQVQDWEENNDWEGELIIDIEDAKQANMKLGIYVAAKSSARDLEQHLKYIPDTLLSFGDPDVRAVARKYKRKLLEVPIKVLDYPFEEAMRLRKEWLVDNSDCVLVFTCDSDPMGKEIIQYALFTEKPVKAVDLYI